MSFAAQNWALDQNTGDPGSKLVLILLATYAGPDGSCFPGQETLALRTGCSERSVRTHLAHLEELGMIQRHERRRKSGSKSSDLIVLCMPANDEPVNMEPVTILPAKSAASKRQNLPESPANSSEVTGKICRNTEDETVRETCKGTPSDAQATPAAGGGVEWIDFAEVYSPRSPKDEIGKSKKAWNELTDAERVVAVRCAGQYCREASRGGKEPMYSSTYLLTRHWRKLAPTGSAIPMAVEWVEEGSPRWCELIASGKKESLLRSMLRTHEGKQRFPNYIRPPAQDAAE